MSGLGPIDLNNNFARDYTDPNPNAEEQNERAWKKAAQNAGLLRQAHGLAVGTLNS